MSLENFLISLQFHTLHFKFSSLLGVDFFGKEGCSYVKAKQSQVMKYLFFSDVCTYDKYQTLRLKSLECRKAAMEARIEKLKHLDDSPNPVYVDLS